VGKTPFDLLDEKDEEKIVETFVKIANKKEPFYGLENWNVHKNGSRVLMETSGVPIIDEKGQLAGYRGIDRDITERKKLQQELEKYTHDLERIVEERTKQLHEKERLATIGQTAGMVGHDIRNPLQAIVSELYYAKETMTEQPDCESKRDAIGSIDFIQEQVDYISKIVSDLQDYARETKPTFSHVNFEDILVAVFSSIAVPDNILLSFNVEPNVKAFSDANFLRRIITNLTSNAIQAMPNGGNLKVSVKKAGNYIQITVQDSGQGIPEDVKDKIFKPLFTTKSKGQGFGLPVVKKFVEQLGGTITFDSQDGKGTTFRIQLPLA
jgi:signal transduction histidine kinase